MKIKKLAVAALMFAAGAVHAQESTENASPFSVDTTAAVYSAYMFRGVNLYDGMSFQPSIQPHYDMGELGRLSGLLWFHLSADGHEDPDKFFEMDDALTYDISVGKFTFSAGHYWYTYPNSSDHLRGTNEVFGSVAIDTMLSPSFTVYHDYRLFDYEYYELNLSHTFEKTGEGAFNFTPFASFGFASNSDKAYESDGFEQSTVGVKTDFDFAGAKLTPLLAYTFGIDDVATDQFWMGLSAVYTF